jgi:hypothetical protein
MYTRYSVTKLQEIVDFPSRKVLLIWVVGRWRLRKISIRREHDYALRGDVLHSSKQGIAIFCLEVFNDIKSHNTVKIISRKMLTQ